MFCPRCGRPVNENANFCAGCGLSKADIEKSIKSVNDAAANVQPAEPIVTPEPEAAQPVILNGEPVKTEAAQPANDGAVNVKFKEEPKLDEPEIKNATASYTWNGNNTDSNSYTSASYSNTSYSSVNNDFAQQSGYVAPKKADAPMSTVDFIWVILISSIPLIGFIYIIYLAIQNDNINKRSYARATLIVSAFVFVITFVFMIGFFMTGVL